MQVNGNSRTAKLVCSVYDSNPDMTLGQLSRITGLTVEQLKIILLNNNSPKSNQKNTR